MSGKRRPPNESKHKDQYVCHNSLTSTTTPDHISNAAIEAEEKKVNIQNNALVCTKHSVSLTVLFESCYYHAMDYGNLDNLKINKYN
jgi:hypothetical protein